MHQPIDLDRIRSRLQLEGTPPKAGLLIGKGPSYQRIAAEAIDLSAFLTVGLNHVVAQQRVDVASVIDLDVVADCAEAIDANAGVLAIPYHPHVAFQPSEKSVFEHAGRHEVLRKLHEEGRLLVYNASTARKLPRLEGAPDLEVRFFSAEAGYEILTLLGAKQVSTVGVDGGRSYAPGFDGKTRLANGRESFGFQFASLNQKFRRTGIPFGPLGSESPIRVFVGCDQTQYLASRVLEYSLCTSGDTAIELERIDNTGLPTPSAPDKRSRTPFSFARFKIPSLCGYRGRAIYVDADMIVFANVRELWELDLAGHDLIYSRWGRERRPQYSVMLLDCERLDWRAEEIVALLEQNDVTYDDIMYEFAFMDRERRGPLVPEAWNSLEVYEPGETKLLHYTDMHRQPWVTKVNPNAPLFYELLRQALESRFISKQEFEAEVVRGHVSPCLPEWIGRERPRGAPSERRWVPPYKQLASSRRSRPLDRLARRLREWL